MDENHAMLCVKTPYGIYVHRAEFVDCLQDMDNWRQSQPPKKKGWFGKTKQDHSLTDLIRLLTAWGEPPGATEGDGGSLELFTTCGRSMPDIRWCYSDVGVCLRVVDLMHFILYFPLSRPTTKAVMSCLIGIMDMSDNVEESFEEEDEE